MCPGSRECKKFKGAVKTVCHCGTSCHQCCPGHPSSDDPLLTNTHVQHLRGRRQLAGAWMCVTHPAPTIDDTPARHLHCSKPYPRLVLAHPLGHRSQQLEYCRLRSQSLHPLFPLQAPLPTPALACMCHHTVPTASPTPPQGTHACLHNSFAPSPTHTHTPSRPHEEAIGTPLAIGTPQ